MLVLLVSYMISGFASGLHSSFGSLYVRDLGASEFMLGLLSSLGALVVAFIRIPGAHIADRHGRKRIIVLFTFGAALGYLVHSLAPDWRFIVLGVLMLNVSRIYMPAMEAIEADSLPEERRGVGYSVITMAPSLTMVVGPPIAGYLRASVLRYYMFVSTPLPPERGQRPSLPRPTQSKSSHSHQQHRDHAQQHMNHHVPQPP